MSDKLGIGDEVICVDDSKPEGWNVEHFPQWFQKDGKYIIREFLNNDDIVAGVLLVELNNPTVYQPLLGRFQESAFATWRFRRTRTAYEIKEEEEYNEIPQELVKEIDELIGIKKEE